MASSVMTASASVTMSSREIADLTSKSHDQVKRDIENMLLQLGEDMPGFCSLYLDEQNRQQTEYFLDRDHVECLLAGYNAVLRMKVIRRLHELEDLQQIPKTLPEALRLAADLAEQKQKLEQELAQAAPKIAFVDRYITSSGAMGFRQICKLLNAREPEFRLFLIENEIMYRLGGVLTPYAQHIDAGRFEVKTGTSDVNKHTFSQARFTPKGVQWVCDLWEKHRQKPVAA